ncbi:uncharacterized protein TRUGW13939_09832 [Talaromyces rugulosus]|uniref:RING-type domain-containing protein n=1 Tax=Talaromyces rugulosus TaxID=121627 RepID=A0A7H8RA95_TALRU|nr:uncharacterized protein TRUGW13939_09832 [Talaromyces rugulosus]QKX62671.1 hypothetical protein TRUGW13939_09832 [Talaromyces rugulosus]
MSAESLVAQSAADSSGLLQTLQGHVEDIRALLQCGICVRPLYEPYTLACGHTFCYGCLTSWFASGRSHKTCPDCRAQVKTQPAPAYLVRTLVQIFTGRAELLDKDETTAEHGKNQREEAEKLEADKSNENPRNGGLFQGFFKPKPQPQGPIIDAEDGVARCPNCAWELEEDSCSNCGYHVDDDDSDGSGFSDDFSDLSDDIDDDDDDDDDMDEDIDDHRPDNHNHNHNYNQSAATWRDPFTGNWTYARPDFDHMRFAEQYFVPAPHVHFHTPHHHHHHSYWDSLTWGPAPSSSIGSVDHTSDGDGQSGSEEEDEDEEMGSFIDDEEVESGTDRSTVVGDHSYTSFDFNNPSSELSALHNAVTHFENVSASGESYGGSEHYEIEESDEEGQGGDGEEGDEDEDEDEGPIRPASRRRPPPPPQPQSQSQPQRRHPNSVSNPYLTAALASLRDGSHRINHRRRPHPSSAQRRTAAAAATTTTAGTSVNNAINLEDDSEDEMPVPASRRARLNRS